MKTTVIIAHPNTDKSFNHAIATAAVKALEEKGHDVTVLDLYKENFDPILPLNEEKLEESELPEQIRSMIRTVRESDGLIFIHPNWWGTPPAILKGFLDRVFRVGFAYKFTPNGVLSLFTDKIAQVFTTSNTPRDVEISVYGDPLENFWKTIVFGLCGCRSFERRNFESIIMSSLEDRKKWLDEVTETIKRRF